MDCVKIIEDLRDSGIKLLATKYVKDNPFVKSDSELAQYVNNEYVDSKMFSAWKIRVINFFNTHFDNIIANEYNKVFKMPFGLEASGTTDIVEKVITSLETAKKQIENKEIILKTINTNTVFNKKKYQIFISSTYEDLKEERDAAIKTILSLYHIPIGMEMFNAGDNDQWTVISQTIETSDYYVVIIGFRYGSTTDTGISYTEKEYDYAVSKGIPVLAFIKDESVSSIPSQRESDFNNQQKLSNFREKAKKKYADFWKTKDEFTSKLSIALHKSFNEKPRAGWVRIGTTLAEEEMTKKAHNSHGIDGGEF